MGVKANMNQRSWYGPEGDLTGKALEAQGAVMAVAMVAAARASILGSVHIWPGLKAAMLWH